MSVLTTSDEKIEKFTEHLVIIRNEIKLCGDTISDAFDPDTWGASDWTEEFVEKSSDLQEQLNGMKRKIDAYLRNWR